MVNKDSIESLPLDVIDYMATNFLDFNAIVQLSKVSKSYKGLFAKSSFWQMLLKKNFNIKDAILSQLIPEDVKKEHFAKQAYYHLHKIRKNQNKLPEFLQTVLGDETQQLLLLNASTDIPDYAFNNVSLEEHFSLVVLSIYADCINIPIRFLDKNKGKGKEREKLNAIHKYAVSANNILLLNYLLDPKNKFLLKPMQNKLSNETQYHDLQLSLNLADNFDSHDDSSALNKAAKKGNLQLVEHLLKIENNLEIKPNTKTLNFAARSGNVRLVRYLLNPENKLNLDVSDDTMHYATRSGNLGLKEHLLTCHIAIQDALQELCQDNFGRASNKFREAFKACPNHFMSMVDYILKNLSFHNLTESQSKCIESIVKNPIAEKEDIKPVRKLRFE